VCLYLCLIACKASLLLHPHYLLEIVGSAIESFFCCYCCCWGAKKKKTEKKNKKEEEEEEEEEEIFINIFCLFVCLDFFPFLLCVWGGCLLWWVIACSC
jgi:hypothetical protein